MCNSSWNSNRCHVVMQKVVIGVIYNCIFYSLTGKFSCNIVNYK